MARIREIITGVRQDIADHQPITPEAYRASLATLTPEQLTNDLRYHRLRSRIAFSMTGVGLLTLYSAVAATARLDSINTAIFLVAAFGVVLTPGSFLIGSSSRTAQSEIRREINQRAAS